MTAHRTADSPSTRARAAFERLFDQRPAVTAVAPGRVNLVGGHVDYNEGIVLPAAIDRVTAVAARPRPDDRLRVHSLTLDSTVETAVGSVPAGWGGYVAGAAAALRETVGHSPGADLVVASDVPVGAGVASSAALTVAVAGALDAIGELGLSPARLARVAWRAETEYVGTDCGIMDHLASACGQAGHVLELDCRDESITPIAAPEEFAVLVVDTGVSHELATNGYDDRVSECQTALTQLETALDRSIPALRDLSPPEVVACTDRLDPVSVARALHVTSEIDRVTAAVDALSAGALDRLGRLMRASHRSLAARYEVSCPELDAAFDALCGTPGVYGSRMIGGGWGGSVLALVEPDAAQRVARRVADRYETETGLSCDTYRVALGDGLRVDGTE